MVVKTKVRGLLLLCCFLFSAATAWPREPGKLGFGFGGSIGLSKPFAIGEQLKSSDFRSTERSPWLTTTRLEMSTSVFRVVFLGMNFAWEGAWSFGFPVQSYLIEFPIGLVFPLGKKERTFLGFTGAPVLRSAHSLSPIYPEERLIRRRSRFRREMIVSAFLIQDLGYPLQIFFRIESSFSVLFLQTRSLRYISPGASLGLRLDW